MQLTANSANLILPAFVCGFGLLIGSFLNVCIYRIPLGKTIVKGRSYCPGCAALIPWYLNIPVASYLALGGRCRNCGMKISAMYPLVELINGILYLVVYWTFGLTAESLLAAGLVSLLLVVSLIDLHHRIIPDGLSLSIFLLGVFHAVYQTVVYEASWYLWIIGFFAASIPLLLLGLIYADGMGGGDIKLMAAAGLYLGPLPILLSLFLGAFYAAIYSLYLFVTRKGNRKTQIPFGPYLSLGIFTSLIWGERIVDWYLSTFVLI